VVVVGSQRSGTTLTGQLLGGHPDAVLLDEEDHLYDWTHAFLGGYFEPPSHRPYTFEQVCCRARAKYRDPDRRIARDGALRPNIRWCVLKAPNLTCDAELIAQHFPSAAVLYMVRDIRDVVASVLRLRGNRILANQAAYLGGVASLNRQYDHHLAAIRDSDLTEEQRLAHVAALKMSLEETFRDAGLATLRVRYEDLVTAPAEQLRRLQEHCGMPADSTSLAPSTIYVGTGPGGTDRRRAPDDASVGKARRVLTREQIAAVEAAAAEVLARLGYRPLAGQPPGHD